MNIHKNENKKSAVLKASVMVSVFLYYCEVWSQDYLDLSTCLFYCLNPVLLSATLCSTNPLVSEHSEYLCSVRMFKDILFSGFLDLFLSTRLKTVLDCVLLPGFFLLCIWVHLINNVTDHLIWNVTTSNTHILFWDHFGKCVAGSGKQQHSPYPPMIVVPVALLDENTPTL